MGSRTGWVEETLFDVWMVEWCCSHVFIVFLDLTIANWQPMGAQPLQLETEKGTKAYCSYLGLGVCAYVCVVLFQIDPFWGHLYSLYSLVLVISLLGLGRERASGRFS